MRNGDFPVTVAHRSGNRFPCVIARAALVVVISAGGAATALADPVHLVTSGTVYQLVEDGETGMGLHGDGFAFESDVDFHPIDTCGPCTPGAAFSLSNTVTPQRFPAGIATIEGHSYDSVYFDGQLSFDAGTVSVPHVPAGNFGIFPTSPFTMTGWIIGYADASLTGAPLFSANLSGRGVARLGFFNYPGGSGVTVDGPAFEFTSPAATPEPASVLLLGSGGAWLASRRRSRAGRVNG